VLTEADFGYTSAAESRSAFLVIVKLESKTSAALPIPLPEIGVDEAEELVEVPLSLVNSATIAASRVL
jgi:hypothetical protein